MVIPGFDLKKKETSKERKERKNLFASFCRGSQEGDFQKGGVGRCSPVPEISSKKSFPAMLAEESYAFPGPKTGTRAHSPNLGITIPGHFLAVLGPKCRKLTAIYRNS